MRTFARTAAVTALCLAVAASPAAAATWAVTPTPGGDLSRLNGVAATSATGAWAVGSAYDFTLGAERTLVERWNGTSWSRVASPNGSQLYNRLYAVDAASAADAWAVGFVETAHGVNGGGDGPKKAAAWHWNGTAWSIGDLPGAAGTPSVTGVDALSAADAWAVGSYYDPVAPARGEVYTAHWNGAAWTRVAAPAPGDYLNEVTSVSGTSGADVWAVGEWRDQGKGQVYHPLALHWDGAAWNSVAAPDPAGGTGGALRAVKAISPTDVWAVGYRDYRTPVAFHYDGTAWREVALPAPGGTGNTILYGLAATAADHVWAVGYTSSGAVTPESLVLRWDGAAWRSELAPPSDLGSTLLGAAAVGGSVLAVGYRNVLSGGTTTNRTYGLRGLN
ncbi:hypothetical protein MF672_019920 [Actinomadura sp. ATCC 31491]|uniref:Carbohydrate-binding protein n=1 Tax=Actinomadura luzonensis TaxID=2805427 RepID=A0ABT0FUN6_9ACTN|nr:hypothetical protein [Actinomadura luzonensis]MCK2216047.1 hypothetical protein [Actinomadura luzonensis]